MNDLPRFVEALGDGHIVQDSCLHGSLSLGSLLKKGNGMANKWQTEQARMDNGLYDFGACSVPQLLRGFDNDFYDANNNNMYNDGLNPCLLDEDYLAYRDSLHTDSEHVTWDFVVLNDQSRYPLRYRRRQKTLTALEDTYVPMLQSAHAAVVLLVTYGYVAQTPITDDDASGWKYQASDAEEDMPYVSSALYHGYKEYQELLELNGIETRLAPVGLAFLTLWEEDIDMWRQLFFADGLHPSPLGTYLEGCVVYATIRGHLPPISIRIEKVSQLWNRARRMNLGKSWYSAFLTEEEASETLPMNLPTRSEAHVLSDVCQRVALEGHMPSSTLSLDELGNGFSYNDDAGNDDDDAAAAADDDDN